MPDVLAKVDIGEYCVYCLHCVDLNSDRYIDRFPALRRDGDNYLRLDGYICAECVVKECVVLETE